MTRSRALTVTGAGTGEQVIAVLAKQRYCLQLTDAGLTEAGVYRDARVVWIVQMGIYWTQAFGTPR